MHFSGADAKAGGPKAPLPGGYEALTNVLSNVAAQVSTGMP